MDQKIRDDVRAHLAFRYVEVDDYATAMALENAVISGDQFCVYVGDRYVLAALTPDERGGRSRGSAPPQPLAGG
jgi:hypothetical protein